MKRSAQLAGRYGSALHGLRCALCTEASTSSSSSSAALTATRTFASAPFYASPLRLDLTTSSGASPPPLGTRRRGAHHHHNNNSGSSSPSHHADSTEEHAARNKSRAAPPVPQSMTGTVPPARLAPHLMTTPGASPGGVQYTHRREAAAAAAEHRRRTVQRATDAQRRGEEPLAAAPQSEAERWWPPESQEWSGRMFASPLNKNKKKLDGMFVPELKEVDGPDKPLELSYEDSSFFANADWHMADETFDETRRFLPPPSFDPAIDDIDGDGFTDARVMLDIQKALDEDKKRLEAFGNPMLVEDQVDYLLAPQREGDENIQQRQEFNGFVHWGLLHGAHMVLEENQETKRAHEFVNRYMRDVDLFQKWLEHPKVRAHIQKKFGIDMGAKFDKLMALTMAMYTRSKIQVYEDDPAGALKSLTACTNMISEGADLKLERHRKALGAVLVARGMVYTKLKSFERADDDLTRALAFVKADRSATLFQLRAEAREGLGRIDEARADEERAAEIWEKAEVVSSGMDGPPRKFVT